MTPDKETKIETHGQYVVLKHEGRGIGLPWAAGIELYLAVKRLAAFSEAYAQHKDHAQVKNDFEQVDQHLAIHRMGLEFTFELDGQIWFQCPWQIARQIALGVYRKAREIEEIEKHAQLTEDAAILGRTGLGIGLALHPQIRKDAFKLAEDIRFPGCIEPESIVPPPALFQFPPATSGD
jgi:hypothetical protein